MCELVMHKTIRAGFPTDRFGGLAFYFKGDGSITAQKFKGGHSVLGLSLYGKREYAGPVCLD